MTLVADFGELRKPTGQTIELWNRERAAAYGRALKLKGLMLPTETAISDLLGIGGYSDPLTDEVFWVDGNPLTELVTGLIPIGIVGLRGSRSSQQVLSSSVGRSMPGRNIRDTRAVTFEFAVLGVSCCAVDRFKRRIDAWIDEAIDGEGMEMRILTRTPEDITDPRDASTVSVGAEWSTIRGVAFPMGGLSVSSQPGAGCSLCGGSWAETVRLTVTATDPWVYNDEVLVGDGLTWPTADASIVCGFDEWLESLCQDPSVETRVRKKSPLGIKIFRDQTACPIGWDLRDWDSQSQYLVPVEFELRGCTPYRVRLRVYDDDSTEWQPVNPGRWPSDGTVPTDCDIIVADIEYPNPDYQPNCPDCAGVARACATTYGFTVTTAGYIDSPPAGTYTWTMATSTTGDTDADNWLAYLQCVGLRTIQELHDACAANGGSPGATVAVDIRSDGATYLNFSGYCDAQGSCQIYALDLPGMNVPQGRSGADIFGAACSTSGNVGSNGPNPIAPVKIASAISDCGVGLADHCFPTRLTTINSLPGDGDETFWIELNDDGTWRHPNWDFDRDGIPPAFATVAVRGKDDAACSNPTNQTLDLRVSVADDKISWFPYKWDYNASSGFPDGVSVSLLDQEPGTYSEELYVYQSPCGCEPVGCFGETGIGRYDCRCSVPLLTAATTALRIPEMVAGQQGLPRVVIAAGSQDLVDFEFRIAHDPLGALHKWDFLASPPVPLLDGDGNKVPVDNVVEAMGESCNFNGFGVSSIPAGGILDIDVRSRRARLMCSTAVSEAEHLLYGLRGPFKWEDLQMASGAEIVAVGAADALTVGYEDVSEPARWSMYWTVRDPG